MTSDADVPPGPSEDRAGGSLGMLGCIAFLVLGIVQIGAGYAGIADQWGGGWALAALVAALVFRFALPLTIGSFFCARDVWGWHWSLALIFALPGLIFIVPGVIASLAARMKR